jgi:hypothetical protein
MPPPGYQFKPLSQRFWEKVDKCTGGCWEWTAYRDREGYGRIQQGGRGGEALYAHRLAVQMDGREIPKGYNIDHVCTNRGCVNPAHLEVVTIGENTRRGGNKKPRQGEQRMCGRGHPITTETAYFRKNGLLVYCKKCRNERRRKNRES